MSNIAQQIKQNLEFIHSFQPHGAAIDLAHNMLLFGALLSAKPDKVLEIGVGTGLATETLIHGIQYNKKGSLDCVDSLYDLHGNFPTALYERLLAHPLVNFIESGEDEFLQTLDSDSYDFVLSDGNHFNTNWDKIFDITTPNGFIFCHDVSNPGYPNLMNYKIRADELGKPNHLFNKNSRPSEDCSRGFLMIINKK